MNTLNGIALALTLLAIGGASSSVANEAAAPSHDQAPPQAPTPAGDAQPVETAQHEEPTKAAPSPASSGDEKPAADHAAPAKPTGEHAPTKQTDTAGHAAPDTAHPKAAPHAAAAKTEHGTPKGTTAGAHGEDPKLSDKEHEVPAEMLSMQAAELLKYAEKAYEDGRFDTAMIAYKQLLSMKMPRAQIRTALIGFARSLRKNGDLTKAVAVYERIVKEFPTGDDTPELYLELGRAQRALGAYKTAITRFYNVINSTIKLPQDGAAKYRQLAKTAQFEIAETYFMAGDYKEASRFYTRLRLLDLAPVDRARAHFKAADALLKGGDLIKAITQLRSFIELNPDDENVPEARYLISLALRKQGKNQEALAEALELLRTERSRTAQDPKRWAYWQRMTGNQIANEFYEQGDTTSALAIYLSLIELSTEPSWRAPIVYQIALCQERQGRTDKAIENYKALIEIAAAQKGDEPRKADFGELANMAKWRLNQIEWVHGAEQRINSLLPNLDTDTTKAKLPPLDPSAPEPAK